MEEVAISVDELGVFLSLENALSAVIAVAVAVASVKIGKILLYHCVAVVLPLLVLVLLLLARLEERCSMTDAAELNDEAIDEATVFVVPDGKADAAVVMSVTSTHDGNSSIYCWVLKALSTHIKLAFCVS